MSSPPLPPAQCSSPVDRANTARIPRAVSSPESDKLLRKMAREYNSIPLVMDAWVCYTECTGDITPPSALAVALHMAVAEGSKLDIWFGSTAPWVTWTTKIEPILKEKWPVSALRVASQFDRFRFQRVPTDRFQEIYADIQAKFPDANTCTSVAAAIALSTRYVRQAKSVTDIDRRTDKDTYQYLSCYDIALFFEVCLTDVNSIMLEVKPVKHVQYTF